MSGSGGKTAPPNKQSISEARKKLCWTFFEKLLGDIVAHRSVQHWKGHPVNIIDGTKVRVPRTEALLKEFGSSASQCGLSHFPTVNIVALTDAFSTLPLALEVGEYNSSERDLAQKLFDKLSPNDLLLLDRGLGGKKIYADLVSRKVFFIHRCIATGNVRPAHVKQLLESGKKSIVVEMVTESGEEPIKIRMIRGADLKGAEPCVYATNLLDEEKYSPEEIHQMYRSRWKIETCIFHLKETLGLEKIKSKTKNSVMQDIYAQFIVLAMAELTARQAETEKKIKPEENKAVSIKFIICLIAEYARKLCSPEAATKAWRKICQKAQDLIWIRTPNRSYPRYSRRPQNRWSQKRSSVQRGEAKKNFR